jgi:hypothetical protein
MEVWYTLTKRTVTLISSELLVCFQRARAQVDNGRTAVGRLGAADVLGHVTRSAVGRLAICVGAGSTGLLVLLLTVGFGGLQVRIVFLIGLRDIFKFKFDHLK